MNNCVAINIISNDKILNSRGIPILFYWDGKNNVQEELYNNEQFIKFLKSRVFTVDQYSGTSIVYFFFREDENDNWNEIYNENIINIQDWIKLNSESTNELVLQYIIKVIEDLYFQIFNSSYKRSSNNSTTVIKEIYGSMKGKYGGKVNKTTFIEYVRVELDKITPALTKENIVYIINELENVLKDSI